MCAIILLKPDINLHINVLHRQTRQEYKVDEHFSEKVNANFQKSMQIVFSEKAIVDSCIALCELLYIICVFGCPCAKDEHESHSVIQNIMNEWAWVRLCIYEIYFIHCIYLLSE